ncbi:permease [Actibacterium lipolyticum]|uniref:Putative permease n=1 Tax=Actibacterium lipolyticum TaxID=1524263 RepID=A0A238JMM5_9RHOB|nr:permease [Actibacterium lipolyticum]SMX31447.1 putative permease [Actibacterium lipolyticum]
MTDASLTPARLPALWRRTDKAWLAILLIPVAIAIFDMAQLWPTLTFAAGAIAHTGVFIVFAVLAVGYLKATGAEALLAKAFEGRETRMILLAAAMGGLSPFCSCEVIPFIAAMLAVGAPLSAVMAFWLASPLMDPAMFLVTSGTLGFDFAIAKTLAAVGIGLFGGLSTSALSRTAIFSDPLKPQKSSCGSCGCGPSPFSGKPVWAFWKEDSRRKTFRTTVIENAMFLGKWLLLAYMIEALMLHYVPAELIANVLGGDGLRPILLGALVGAPAYLNGFAAVPLVDSLLQQGMSDGAAMSFVLAGGVSCIPAAIAVWALVKPKVFAAYIGFAMIGAIIAGVIWSVAA